MFNMLPYKTIIVLTCGVSKLLLGLGVSQPLGVHDRIFYKLPNTSLVGNVKLATKVKDSLGCSFLCLEHGPFVCLSFNFGKDNESAGYYTCELSNSERYLEPHMMQEQSIYDYYGTTAEVSYKLTICNCKMRFLLKQTEHCEASSLFCNLFFLFLL